MPFVPPPQLITFRFDLSEDDTFVEFPAYLQNISTQASANWEGFNRIGRADDRYVYSEFSKTISIDFTVVAEQSSPTILSTLRLQNPRSTFEIDSDRSVWDIFDKLEALAQLTVPYYSGGGFKGRFAIFTIGEIYVKQPGYVTNLSYEWDNTSNSWDLDYQLPMLTNVSMSITWAGRTMPRGQAKYFSYNKDVSGRQVSPNIRELI
jgi:hypothetical protein